MYTHIYSIHKDYSRRSYSNIDLTSRPSLKRQKSNNNDGNAVPKRTREEGAEAITNSEED